MTLAERMAIESKNVPSAPRHDVDRTGLIREKVVLFGSASSLVGIVTDPIDATDATRPGVILLNAGLLHRIGPNRLHVELARRLAAKGLVVLRFDFSGIGDSDVREDDLPFWESAILETQEAMTFLEKSRGLRRFVLMGLCSGAVSLFRTARVDSRVAGAVLLDPWGYSAESSCLATTRLYWQSVWSVVRSPGRWMDSIPRHLDVRVILRHLRRTLKRRKPDGTRRGRVSRSPRAWRRAPGALQLSLRPRQTRVRPGRRRSAQAVDGVRPRDVRGLPRRDAHVSLARPSSRPPRRHRSMDPAIPVTRTGPAATAAVKMAGVTPLALPLRLCPGASLRRARACAPMRFTCGCGVLHLHRRAARRDRPRVR